MKVIHVIPAAFEYFDDIKSSAFKLIEKLHTFGIENEAFTLQYGTVSKKVQESAAKTTPSTSYSLIKTENINDAISSFSDFDIIHLHCPFLGAAGKIIKWKIAHPAIPLIVTYYRDVKIIDLLSVFIKFYNAYYLPKIFSLAEFIICDSVQRFNNSLGKNYTKTTNNILEIDRSEKFMGSELPLDLEVENRLAFKHLIAYNELCLNLNK